MFPLWLKVSAYGFMTPDYNKYSDHYYDSSHHPVVFYANHDMRLEMTLWQQLHQAGLIRLYMHRWAQEVMSSGLWRLREIRRWSLKQTEFNLNLTSTSVPGTDRETDSYKETLIWPVKSHMFIIWPTSGIQNVGQRFQSMCGCPSQTYLGIS